MISTTATHAALVSVINPLGRTIVSSPTSGDTISIGDFQSLITTTANTNKAGVFDHEVGAGGNITVVEPDYLTPDFTITGATRYGRNDAGGVTGAVMTSGGRFGYVNGSETWTLVAETPGEVVTHFGATFSNRQAGALLLDVVATFSDSSTSTFTSTAVVDDYGFFGFQAPAGLGITSVQINELGTGNWLAYDDISFVVGAPVPEPTGTSLLGLAACGILLRRRR